ncbi:MULTISPECIES: helix-turn-helix domain-containing protein [Lactobacillaceae]|uniref:helix-turn-helix domain-containing protein n=1 Tax=Lactobacillaceae TaxID=33958 RepID=UPI001CC1E905|nr:helix-turn-helix domain-containing protein [Lentilactobacillus hilgardii]MBZ2202552.1 hypothetical protein [Lentilactobacillus hilgardii]MBZ2205513.1 hypothetical protein [Lentilactobacillus hilgardii]
MDKPFQSPLSDDQFDSFKQLFCQMIEGVQSGQEKQWLRKAEAAEYADVSIGTFRKWVRNGLPEKAVGGVKLYKKSDIDDWIEEFGD